MPDHQNRSRASAELEQIYRTAPVGLCFLDTDLRFIRINERLAEINGRSVADHVGHTIREILPEMADIVEPIYRAVIETRQPILDLEIQGITQAEPREKRIYVIHYFPVVENDTVMGINSVVQDITERKTIELEMSRQARILARVSDSVVVTNMWGLIESWNEAAERTFGYPEDEALGREVQDLLCFPEDREMMATEILDPLIRTGSHNVVTRHRRADGEAILVDLRLSLLHDHRDNPIAMIGCSHDVTDSFRLRNEMLEASTEIQRQVGQDLHDVTGQELTGMGFLARTLSNCLHEEGSAHAGLADRLVEGIEQVLGQVRTFCRGLIPVGIDADGLVVALEDLSIRITELGDTTCQFQGDRVTMRDGAAATHLFRIVQEAVANAMRHGEARNIDVSLRRQGAMLRLTVTDDGHGFEKDREKLGTGVRTMRHRAEVIGGTLRIEPSTPGGGARVICTVPHREGS